MSTLSTPETPQVSPVELRTLVNGEHFRFKPGAPTFERLKGGFRTHPDGDNGRWFPIDLSTPVYPVGPAPADIDQPDAAPAPSP